MGLYGKEKIAVDGSKFRAQNSKKNNYNAKKITHHLNYIENQMDKYINTLAQTDSIENKEDTIADFDQALLKI